MAVIGDGEVIAKRVVGEITGEEAITGLEGMIDTKNREHISYESTQPAQTFTDQEHGGIFTGAIEYAELTDADRRAFEPETYTFTQFTVNHGSVEEENTREYSNERFSGFP